MSVPHEPSAKNRLARRDDARTGDVVPIRPRPGDDPDDGLPQDADLKRFSGVTQTCPECKAELYDEATICHECGRALGTSHDRTPAWWILPLVVLIAIAMVVVLLV